MRANVVTAVAAVGMLVFAAPVPAAGSTSRSGDELFVSSAVEHADDTVTLPLHRGTSQGRTVWYVVLDASTSEQADRFGVNRSNKLARAVGTAAVARAGVRSGVLDFPATVDFAPVRQVVPGAQGFPPAVAVPGAVGEAGYTPLVRLPDGSVINAPHVANATGRADKVVSLDLAGRRVRLAETRGFARGERVRYLSTEASDPGVAALENVTYAPALDAAPFAGGDGTDSSRASLAAFVNGQTGAANPQRQGLSSALLDRLDPLNLLAWLPNQGRYSPLWDVHLARWSDARVAAGTNVRQRSFAAVEDLAETRAVTAPDGSAFRPSGVVVNCPIISSAG
jgi:hypothetical protein